MRKQTYFIIAVILSSLMLCVSCYKQPDSIGFLSDNIYLRGADTIFIPIGGKGATNYAWIDYSSQPCTFSIEDVTDLSGVRSEQFFEEFTYRTWKKPYDFLTDKTEEDVLNKLQDTILAPLVINPINGQLIYTEVTKNLSSAGDVFHVAVRVTNSAGSKVFPEYATIKLTSTSRPFTVNEVINGISVVKGGGNNFVLYDQINDSQPDFVQRRNNIYADNGEEFVRIHKKSDEPNVGIKVIFKLLDDKGALFNPAEYATYAAGTYSYIDHAINRQNTSEGMILEFPTTPWPTDVNLRSYLKGPTATDFRSFNLDKLHQDFLAGKVASLIAPVNWPANNWADADAWFVRIRSIITFYESGTWEVSCKIPYTAIDGNFN